jgi:hypothetical protein
MPCLAGRQRLCRSSTKTLRPIPAGVTLSGNSRGVDHVIPPVPVRQWVISVPKRLRCFLANRPEAVAALTKIFLAEIERLLSAAAAVTIDAAAPAAARPRLGAEPPRASARVCNRRRLHAGCWRSRLLRLAGVPARTINHAG